MSEVYKIRLGYLHFRNSRSCSINCRVLLDWSNHSISSGSCSCCTCILSFLVVCYYFLIEVLPIVLHLALHLRNLGIHILYCSIVDWRNISSIVSYILISCNCILVFFCCLGVGLEGLGLIRMGCLLACLGSDCFGWVGWSWVGLVRFCILTISRITVKTCYLFFILSFWWCWLLLGEWFSR